VKEVGRESDSGLILYRPGELFKHPPGGGMSCNLQIREVMRGSTGLVEG
jgi:hypothetical protein